MFRELQKFLEYQAKLVGCGCFWGEDIFYFVLLNFVLCVFFIYFKTREYVKFQFQMEINLYIFVGYFICFIR